MEARMTTEQPIMQAMMAQDADGAFACTMVPHHSGAIRRLNSNLAAMPRQNNWRSASWMISREIEESGSVDR